MIILDTNVISACMRPEQNAAVIAWLNRQPPADIWTTTISIFELRYGIECLVTADHRAQLEKSWDEIGSAIFQNRILQFDMRAAQAAAALSAERRRNRRSVGVQDTFIAGITLSRGATLATRNTKDFRDAGVPLVDPWKAGAE